MSSINLINNLVLQGIEYQKPNEIPQAGQVPSMMATEQSSILQKQASFIQNSSGLRKSIARSLNHHPSKLDLIDDTTLTSLPLPPPLKPKSRASTSSSGLKLEEDNSIHPIETNIAYLSEKDDSNYSEEESFNQNDEEESEDPIVLIEDYMNNRNSNGSDVYHEKHLINRKKSLATFKQKIYHNGLKAIENVSEISTVTSIENNENELPASTITLNINNTKPNNKRTISNETVRPVLNFSKPENLEEIFGKIPGTDLLKYCDLCEKPLYEISSIINGSKRFKKCRLNNPITKENEGSNKVSNNSVNEFYTEFICWECVEIYEEFFNELYQHELNVTNINTSHSDNDNDNNNNDNDINNNEIGESSNLKLLDIFQNIVRKYDNLLQLSTKRYHNSQPIHQRLNTKSSFSENLINNLKHLHDGNPQHQISGKKSIDIEWIRNLQHKLRWRWRFTGLIPSSFKYDDSNSSK